MTATCNHFPDSCGRGHWTLTWQLTKCSGDPFVELPTLPAVAEYGPDVCRHNLARPGAPAQKCIANGPTDGRGVAVGHDEVEGPVFVGRRRW